MTYQCPLLAAEYGDQGIFFFKMSKHDQENSVKDLLLNMEIRLHLICV